MRADALKRRVAGGVDARLVALLGIIHRLHANPETAWQEQSTTSPPSPPPP
jgi:metal-dependent amidase/aminoacylase/carboxypeptidase family protein